jgi:hypothetical protein
VNRSPVPFAFWLPVFSAALWLALIAIPVTPAFIGLAQTAHGTGVAHLAFGPFKASIPRSRFLSFAAEATSVRFGRAVMALNMPGMFVGALISYKPANMLVDEWRCFSLPLFCLWAWWFIGVGLDGLVGRRRIHWSVMALGALLSITCLVLLIGLRFGLDASNRAEMWPLWGLGLWATLFAIVPSAWWRGEDGRGTRQRNSKPSLHA